MATTTRTAALTRELAVFKERHGHLVTIALDSLAMEMSQAAQQMETLDASGQPAEPGIAEALREAQARYEAAAEAWDKLEEALEEAMYE